MQQVRCMRHVNVLGCVEHKGLNATSRSRSDVQCDVIRNEDLMPPTNYGSSHKACLTGIRWPWREEDTSLLPPRSAQVHTHPPFL